MGRNKGPCFKYKPVWDWSPGLERVLSMHKAPVYLPAHVLGVQDCGTSSSGKPLHPSSSSCTAPLPTRCLCSAPCILLFQRLNSRCTELIILEHHVMATIIGFMWLSGQLRLAKRTVATENAGRMLIYPQPECTLIASEC